MRQRKRKREEQFFIEHGYFPGDRSRGRQRRRRHGDSAEDDKAALLRDLDTEEDDRRRGRVNSEEAVELEPLGSSLDSAGSSSSSGGGGSSRKRWSTMKIPSSSKFRVKLSASHADMPEYEDDDVVGADGVIEEEQLAHLDAVDVGSTDLD